MLDNPLNVMYSTRMNNDKHFFNATACDRCGESLHIRTCSWFNDQVIGEKCMDEEKRIKDALKARGDTCTYEGCGYVPTV